MPDDQGEQQKGSLQKEGALIWYPVWDSMRTFTRRSFFRESGLSSLPNCLLNRQDN